VSGSPCPCLLLKLIIIVIIIIIIFCYSLFHVHDDDKIAVAVAVTANVADVWDGEWSSFLAILLLWETPHGVIVMTQIIQLSIRDATNSSCSTASMRSDNQSHTLCISGIDDNDNAILYKMNV